MRTRTLLLLAIGCGLAILVAGTVQLLRIAGQDETTALGVGDRGSAGEATVTVAGFAEADGYAVVTVELGGVDDPAGLDSFRLQAPNTLVEPVPAESSCDGITVTPTTCTIAFPAANLDGRDRQLVFRRGEEQVRWVLV
ncbi:MAG: hypothetical protein R2694_03405 [Ilumatobacteraceae bacterium]|nr:hypothetical protein [Ilumatobacter sp.]MCB0982225.1 hypothetical protein [Ilumatobacter sp.]MCB9379579.1 hypothetical protein [Acidimicrobiaceae bacterium]MCO5331511.1 hypothetical protein [Ilumatobacteraceae bacterium]